MNFMKKRPASSASTGSKKSSGDDRISLSVDKNSVLNSSSTNVSLNNQRCGLKTQSLVGGDASVHPVPSTSRGLSSSESNIKVATSISTSLNKKETRTRNRISIRNFISRALFSNRTNNVSDKPRSSTSSGGSSTKKNRKPSTTSTKSANQLVQPSGIVPQQSSSTPIPPPVSSSVVRDDVENGQRRCNVCYGFQPVSLFPVLQYSDHCKHHTCLSCYREYITVQVSESRVDLTCPECDAVVHPNDIKAILNNDVMMAKYEQFMMRRVLVNDLDTRWCPAPDCGYAVIASGCAECPRLVCEREECGTAFCYHCSGKWHPDSTCDEARAQRLGLSLAGAAVGAVTFRRTPVNALFAAAPSSSLGKIKPCPRCKALIAKMDDGSCNHMTCTMCGADFCWLCMKEISDLHFLSPTGCTFWGKKPWSRKKKLICQLGTLIGAPIGIALVAGVAIPSMIIGIPIWVGRKIFNNMTGRQHWKRNVAMVGGVTGAVLISPAVAALVVGFGVPLMLAYVYGVVPFSLCRSGGTCRSSNSSDSLSNSASNLSAEDMLAHLPEEDASGAPNMRQSSVADSGSLDIVTQQLRGSKTPDDQLMLRMMMVLDDADAVFGHQGSQGDSRSVTGASARIRHRAEINHSHRDYQNASIGEFSMDSDAHSQKRLIVIESCGQSELEAGGSSQQDNESHAAGMRANEEERPNFDAASTVALHLSVRRQSASSESVNCSLGDRVTLETMSSDLDCTLAAVGNREYLEVSEQDNASTKALAGSIIEARYLALRSDATAVTVDHSPVSPVTPIAPAIAVAEEFSVSTCDSNQ